MVEELVLTFHGIGTPRDNILAAERPYWIERDDFCRVLDDMARVQARELRVVATFDDGNLSDYEIAAPELAARGLSAIFFPCSNRIGQQGYLEAAHLAALAAQGFEIGSHGVEHLSWKGMSLAALETEVGLSKTAITAALGQPVTQAALPFGGYDRTTLSALRRAGYTRVYSSDPGMSPPDSWFRRRWSWIAGCDFDIAGLVRISRSPRHRLVSGFKHQMKARR